MHLTETQNPIKGKLVSGLFQALTACFFWGLVFVIPQFLNDFKDLEIVLGRCTVFGLCALTGSFFYSSNFFKKYSFKVWRVGFIWSILTNPIYYLGIVIGVRYAGHPITIVTSGLTPILILIFSNAKSKEVSHTLTITISGVILAGVLATNASIFDQPLIAGTLQESLIGIGCVIVSTLIWTLYIIKNGKFLIRHPEINDVGWSYILGISTLFFSIIALIICSIFNLIDLKKLVSLSNPKSRQYLIGVLILGVVSSNLATIYWNKASTKLTASLLGALVIFESIFGLIMSFAANSTLPSLKETVGIILMFGGSLFGLALFGRKAALRDKNHSLH